MSEPVIDDRASDAFRMGDRVEIVVVKPPAWREDLSTLFGPTPREVVDAVTRIAEIAPDCLRAYAKVTENVVELREAAEVGNGMLVAVIKWPGDARAHAKLIAGELK